ncbi:MULTISPECIES: hypothetical protein [Afipia]|uniref:DUF2946 domain-containing protein n=2 Tax=Afipia felis TaxID=1035 RepID=A0A380W2R9_AFIFE|nr:MULTISPECIES: hypothetical protein [Afipia]EFI53379.1 conserved hypothetical protein [Afipia sp. 1NLS2]EKS30433.1 hypothetical protein HMPREF9697_02961 [Afipia felis ATCC 53690]SUU75178.1 Uncharacterised protein [Afipia felis]SUU83244.1 Uncharacterised protein [Afipia felis]
MKRWSATQLVALFLAVFVTVGMSLSAVQASDMTAKMAMASDMGAPGHNGCDCCPSGGNDNDMKAMPCAAFCVAPVLAVLPQVTGMALVQRPGSPIAARVALLNGRASPPGPHPPRPASIG